MTSPWAVSPARAWTLEERQDSERHLWPSRRRGVQGVEVALVTLVWDWGVPPLGFVSLFCVSLLSVPFFLSFLESSMLLSTCTSEFVGFLSILRKARVDFRLPILVSV